MPATVNATLLGKNKSVVRATTASTAGATSVDVLTVNHGIGASPDQIVTACRTIRAVVSTGTPALILDSWDATVATFRLPAVNAGAAAADFDIVFERTHSIVR